MLLGVFSAILQHLGMQVVWKNQYLYTISAIFSVFTNIIPMKFKMYSGPK